ncbi:P-loop containing nucleoside triphosphate hydrolase protein [Aaosphaeria arxii CBS 175.79]|uniref:P-loop containing nucleoside triphosphate hydrolase protein n=1 Tax=Aaosphaeria arxii CBS 175.79 TaxID=1450172 RepID=A0A6A5Y668_9PLEO|nr:P-loop containing nucleoside triphosphate hydrolase protein [Aaosphaeria arxii CBS 175.79]KAF2021052.1 P-loop containing nucleoside triphosphate hydrolase protein [Aaosphaeria arxii CBS 175.79]
MAHLISRPASQFVCRSCAREGFRPQFLSQTLTIQQQTRSIRLRPGRSRIVRSESRELYNHDESELEIASAPPPRERINRLRRPQGNNEGRNIAPEIKNVSTTNSKQDSPRPTKSKPEAVPLDTSKPKTTEHAWDAGIRGDYNYYWETFAPTTAQKAKANKFFTKGQKAQFLRSVSLFRQFPEGDVPEVAFVGRSNVGKSSLLNAVVDAGAKDILARTSATPGFTRTMNLYGVGGIDGVRIKKGRSGGHDRIIGIGGVLIVDLPGYGEGSLSEWGTEIMKYFTKRKQLRRVFVLVDAMHGLKESDENLLSSLREGGVPHQVVLSKLDRLYIPEAKRLERMSKGSVSRNIQPKGTISQVEERMIAMRSEIKPPTGAGALGELLGVSAEVLVNGDRLGMDSLRFAILQAAGFSFDDRALRKAHEKRR